MDPYRTLDIAYQHIASRTRQPEWQRNLGDIDTAVATIRDHDPYANKSDTLLRHLVQAGRVDSDALTVTLYALAPALRARTSRAVTAEYRNDALADLAFVLLDSPLDTPNLVRRLVNRAHNRVYKAARRVHQRGATHPVTVAPHDPERLIHHQTPTPDPANAVADRLDLTRFHDAVLDAIATGKLAPGAWIAYRDHKLRRAIDPTSPACDGVQRKLAARAATRLQPLIDTHLHVA